MIVKTSYKLREQRICSYMSFPRGMTDKQTVQVNKHIAFVQGQPDPIVEIE
jgi:predicted HAD superfamily phosphohydrolase